MRMADFGDAIMGVSAFILLLASVVTMLVLSVRDRKRRRLPAAPPTPSP